MKRSATNLFRFQYLGDLLQVMVCTVRTSATLCKTSDLLARQQHKIKKVNKRVLALRRRKASMLYHLISVVFADNFCTQATQSLTNDILLLSWKHQHSMHRQLGHNSNVMLHYSNLNASSFGGVNSISAVKLLGQPKTRHGNARVT